MREAFQTILILVEQLSQSLPAPVFVVVGSIIEEIIAPIPSPLVMTGAGSLAATQGQGYLWLLVLAVLGAVGKSVGYLVFYLLGDKAEDLIIGKYGRFFGLDHSTVEHIGARFSGSIRDELTVFICRAVPIIPSAPVSVVAGVIKLRFMGYLVASFLGTIVRNCLFLYLGYVGFSQTSSLVTGLEDTASLIQVGMAVVVALIVAAAYIYRHRSGKKP